MPYMDIASLFVPNNVLTVSHSHSHSFLV